MGFRLSKELNLFCLISEREKQIDVYLLYIPDPKSINALPLRG